MKTEEFNYQLPHELIAQKPVNVRDDSRLLVYDSLKNKVYHKKFYEITEFLGENDLLVINDSRVIPARIKFRLAGKEVEIFLIRKIKRNVYSAMVRPGKAFREGNVIAVGQNISATVLEVREDGIRVIEFDDDIIKYGVTPLPPYIKNENVDSERYQTVYAEKEGSVAAPTAGLHFTKELMGKIKGKGVSIEKVTLHVGPGTFLPVKSKNILEHKIHKEEVEVSQSTAKRINLGMQEEKRIIAVGTTTVRTLESLYDNKLASGKIDTNIFIYPGYKWKVVDALITNFHLPKSTLMMLVASFLENKGVDDPIAKLKELYQIAIDNDYRFYSFGDAMFIF